MSPSRSWSWLSAALLLLSLPARATWSIVAVDEETEEVGIAGATCGPMVWFIAGLVPGEGVIAAQYATSRHERETGEDLLREGERPAAVLKALRAQDEDAALRQYGIVALGEAPVTFTGGEVEGPALTVEGEGWTAQGNTLASEAVVEAAAAVMEAGEGSLADRLMEALEAGAAEGGDARCAPEDAAKSAFLYVAEPGDRAHEPTVEVRASGAGAVEELADDYAAGRMSCSAVGGVRAGGLGLLWAVMLGGLSRRRPRGR